jgi:hypothetical protein
MVLKDGSPTATAAEGRQRTSLVGLCRGVAAFLTHDLDGQISLVPVRGGSDESRFSPNLAAREWTRERFPAWHALLADLESTGEYPRDSNSVLRPFLADEPLKNRIVGVEKITDYKTLRNDVRTDPSYWRDGAGPNFVETDPARQATNNAGELLALLLGARGVVMTQLWAGWEDDDTQQPVDAPFALRALRECASDLNILAIPAPVPGLTARKGLTADPQRGRIAVPRAGNAFGELRRAGGAGGRVAVLPVFSRARVGVQRNEHRRARPLQRGALDRAGGARGGEGSFRVVGSASANAVARRKGGKNHGRNRKGKGRFLLPGLWNGRRT